MNSELAWDQAVNRVSLWVLVVDEKWEGDLSEELHEPYCFFHELHYKWLLEIIAYSINAGIFFITLSILDWA